ncbi:hypothetical protein LV779_01775 [Streptomyces thinghirensis]|nr:hypothetical protein [Streptomyces thinghirensis]
MDLASRGRLPRLRRLHPGEEERGEPHPRRRPRRLRPATSPRTCRPRTTPRPGRRLPGRTRRIPAPRQGE